MMVKLLPKVWPLSDDGAVEYYYVDSDGRALGRGEISSGVVAEEHAKLASRIDECRGAQKFTEPRPGILGLIGFKQTDIVCPALAAELNTHDASAVRQYFQ